MEILEDVTPDIVVVCCGGGGLLAGIASAIKLNGHDSTRIYGVEPETGKFNWNKKIIFDFTCSSLGRADSVNVTNHSL